MQFSPALQKLLDAFNEQSGGTSIEPSSAYKSMVEALKASPLLRFSYSSAADSGALTALNSITTAEFAGEFGQSEYGFNLPQGAITFNASFIGRDTNHAYSTIQDMGHELQHLANSVSIAQAHKELLQKVSHYYANISNLGNLMDVTNIVQSYKKISLEDEGRAEIEGWNSMVSAIAVEDKSLLTNQYFDQLHSANEIRLIDFANDGYDINLDKSSDSYMMVKVTPENIAKAGIAFSADKNYQIRYNIEGLDNVASYAKGQPFAVDFSKLGFSSTDVTDKSLMRHGFFGGVSGQATLIDVTNHNVHTFSTTKNNESTSIHAKTTSAEGQKLSETIRTVSGEATTSVETLYNPTTGKAFERTIADKKFIVQATVKDHSTVLSIKDPDGTASKILPGTNIDNLKLDYSFDKSGNLNVKVSHADNSPIEGNKKDITLSISHEADTSKSETTSLLPETVANQIYAHAAKNGLTDEATQNALQLAEAHYLQQLMVVSEPAAALG